MQKPPGATNTERLYIDFLLPDCSERYKSDLEHLNYIISRASWQGALFLYPFSRKLLEEMIS
nr:MAG TPA: hypothetical protein [Caudoviricetes sp.]